MQFNQVVLVRESGRRHAQISKIISRTVEKGKSTSTFKSTLVCSRNVVWQSATRLMLAEPRSFRYIVNHDCQCDDLTICQPFANLQFRTLQSKIVCMVAKNRKRPHICPHSSRRAPPHHTESALGSLPAQVMMNI